MEQLLTLSDRIAVAIELLGVASIVITIVAATSVFLYRGRSDGWRIAYDQYRANLGRGILLGLELLVGADIIATVTAPLTVESVSLLGGIVAIRTVLSFALETEIEGCWPWQRRAIGEARSERR